jgi:hypothetical protein
LVTRERGGIKRGKLFRKMASSNTETSLTSKVARNPDFVKKSNMAKPTLNEEHLESAAADLMKQDLVKDYPKFERAYVDPPLTGQVYSLHSFIPSSGATPDENGMYGMLKMRGSFQTLQEAQDRSEWLIVNHDSYHPILTSFTGKPYPVSDSTDFSQRVNRVNFQKNATTILSEDVRKRMIEEKQALDEGTSREDEVHREATEGDTPEDRYIVLRVKQAQLSWTYLDALKKVKDMRANIFKTRKEIVDMDAENISYKERYMEKYLYAREKVGVASDPNEDSFMRYLNVFQDVGPKELVLGYVAEDSSLVAEHREAGIEQDRVPEVMVDASSPPIVQPENVTTAPTQGRAIEKGSKEYIF